MPIRHTNEIKPLRHLVAPFQTLHNPSRALGVLVHTRDGRLEAYVGYQIVGGGVGAEVVFYVVRSREEWRGVGEGARSVCHELLQDSSQIHGRELQDRQGLLLANWFVDPDRSDSATRQVRQG